jgi:hypothetical protein
MNINFEDLFKGWILLFRQIICYKRFSVGIASKKWHHPVVFLEIWAKFLASTTNPAAG